VRDPRLSRSLVLAAHGSTDPRFAEVVEAIATQVRARRADLDVRIGYLDHGPPSIADVVDGDCTVVPLLLSAGYHVRVDIPTQAPGVVITEAVGPDPSLVTAVAERLREAGYDGRAAVTLVAAGSSEERALDEVRAMARQLGEHLGVDVTAAFIGSGSPRLSELGADVVASYLLAPGAFHDTAIGSGADIISAPIGAHPVLAEIALARYDAATQVPGRIAPA
jgi:sirohydrochlorin ferrochelatase